MLVAAACARDAATSGPAVVTRDSAGITIVESDHRRPVWGPENGWRLAPEPSIQVGNIPDLDQQLYQVNHSVRLRNGGIAVANTGLGDVRVFDARGGHVRTTKLWDGESADRPRPLRVHELGGDSLLVLVADGSIHIIDGDGRVARTSKLASGGTGLDAATPIAGFRDGTLLARAQHAIDSSSTGVQRSRVRMLRYAQNGALLGSFGDFDDQTLLLGGKGGYVFGRSGYEAVADSTFWYGSADRFELREIGADGRTLRMFRLDRPEEPVTRADKFAYRQAALGPVRGTEREEETRIMLDSSAYAETFPAHAEFIVDALGNLWVRRYRWYEIGGNRQWTVIDRDGRYLGEVTTPSVLEIHHIGEDYLVGRMANGRSEAVYIWGLEKPAS
jgi:hypothetical protein